MRIPRIVKIAIVIGLLLAAWWWLTKTPIEKNLKLLTVNFDIVSLKKVKGAIEVTLRISGGEVSPSDFQAYTTGKCELLSSRKEGNLLILRYGCPKGDILSIHLGNKVVKKRVV